MHLKKRIGSLVRTDGIGPPGHLAKCGGVCCDMVTDLSIVLSLTDNNYNCTFNLPADATSQNDYEWGASSSNWNEYFNVVATTTGLAGLNGTWLYSNYGAPGECTAAQHNYIGSITVNEAYTAIVVQLFIFGIYWWWQVSTYTGTSLVATYDAYLGSDGLWIERQSYTGAGGHTGTQSFYKRVAVPFEPRPNVLEYHSLPLDSGPNPITGLYDAANPPQEFIAFQQIASCGAPLVQNITWPTRTFSTINQGCQADLDLCEVSNCRSVPQLPVIGTMTSDWV